MLGVLKHGEEVLVDFSGAAGAPSQMALSSEVSPVEAVHDLYQRDYRRLVRLAMMLLGDLGRAEEIVQDAFVDLMSHWAKIRDQAAALSYLRTSVANGARSELRHLTVIRRYRAERRGDVNSAEVDALADVEHERIMTALSMLPARQCQVLILRYYGELSEAEIAQSLGISRGAVKSHSFRGLRAMRPVLEVQP
jgi:RNA polymerase sigma-70 factor (sigma-E family)